VQAVWIVVHPAELAPAYFKPGLAMMLFSY